MIGVMAINIDKLYKLPASSRSVNKCKGKALWSKLTKHSTFCFKNKIDDISTGICFDKDTYTFF